MIHVDGSQAITIEVSSGNIYEIEYEDVAGVNIVNYTDGSIFVSEVNDFETTDGVGQYLTLTDGNMYNEYLFYKSGTNKLYIKCDADGHICLVRKLW